MARTVIIAEANYQHSDADYSDANNYRYGYIVQSFGDGQDLGSKVGLPRFAIIDTPGVPLSAVRQYEEDFNREVLISIINSDLAIDGHRVDLTVTNKTVSGKGSLTRAKAESFLNDWGGVVVSATQARIRFDVTVYGFLTSPRMWGGFPVVFNEISYDQTTGVHRIEAAYDNAPVTQQAMTKAEAIVGANALIISNDPGSIVFEITRADAFEMFKSEIKERLEQRFLTRRYYVDPAVVDQAVIAGGSLTMTGAEALASIKDLAAE